MPTVGFFVMIHEHLHRQEQAVIEKFNDKNVHTGRKISDAHDSLNNNLSDVQKSSNPEIFPSDTETRPKFFMGMPDYADDNESGLGFVRNKEINCLFSFSLTSHQRLLLKSRARSR